MLREETVIDRIEVLEGGEVLVRRARRIFDGDTLLAETYHRDAPLAPGDPTDAVDARVRQVAGAVWTPEVIEAHRAKRQRREAGPVRA